MDKQFYVYSQKQLQRNINLIFPPPTRIDWTKPKVDGSLKDRGTIAFVSCAIAQVAEALLPYPKLSAWFNKIRTAQKLQRISSWRKLFDAATIRSLERIETDIFGDLLDKSGFHSCTELFTWINFFKDAIVSVAYNKGTHLVLHIYGYEWAGPQRQCKVNLRWGPDIGALNNSKSFYMDNWSTQPDCPGRKSNWDMPIKYSVLDKPFPG